MKLFIDTNVMVDLLAHRQPFYEEAFVLFSLVDKERYDAVVASMSYATTAYVLGRGVPHEKIALTLRQFSSIVEIAAVDEKAVRKAIADDCKFVDIEDAMQYYTALQASCDCIITRNKKDFVNSDIPVFTPAEFLASIQI